MIDRRTMIGRILALLTANGFWRASAAQAASRVFDVHDFGAVGDGRTEDTAAIQHAIEAAAKAGGRARVLLRAGRSYLTGPLRLAGGIDLHLAGDAHLLVSVDPGGYDPVRQSALWADGADGLSISGTGTIDGRSAEFMDHYDHENEWWIPKPFRPRLLVIENSADIVLRDLTFRNAPSWTVHLLGCRRVLVDHVTIANQLDVPNCDGIDPDHCQDVEIRNCHITCGDDAIVIKTTRGHDHYGPSHNIRVHDCVLATQDSGLKIGTETCQDIYDVRFERCRILTGCRGLCIQLRDEGNVRDILFRDIEFVSRYHSPPWWGRGEAISFTAIPRNPETRTGTIRRITVENVTGRAENSIRIEGLGGSRVSDVTLRNVAVTFDRWTAYPGGVFDNRPTSATEPLEHHDTPAISIRHADRVTLDHCTVSWGHNPPEHFTHAIEAEDVTRLERRHFTGTAAHPGRQAAIVIR